MQYRTDNDRTKFLGASEAPAVIFGHHSHEEAPVGMPKYLSAFDVWAKKVGGAGAEVDAASTARGHHLEDAVFKWGAEKVNAVVATRGGNYDSAPVQGLRPWAAFHPDGQVSTEEHGHCIAEVKVYRDGKGWGDDAIPAWVAAQVTYQLACCPDYIKGCYIFAYITSRPDDVIVRYIERDQVKEKAMLDICEGWWNRHVVANVPPPFDGGEGGDAYLLDQHPKQNGLLEEATEDEMFLVTSLQVMKEDAKALKDSIDTCSQQLKSLIGDREGVFVADVGAAKWKWQKGRAGFDSKRFAVDHPKLFAEYATVGKETRVLRLPKVKK